MTPQTSEPVPPAVHRFDLSLDIELSTREYVSANDFKECQLKPIIQVMIVEDHPLLIQGLRSVIEMEEDLKVISWVADGCDAIAEAALLRPDVILMDINLPGKNGLQATREITSIPNLENTGIIILTAYHDDEQLFHALRSGASAYYPKDIEPEVLLPAIREVAMNRCVIHGEVMTKSQAYRWLIDQLRSIVQVDEVPEEIFSPLTSREKEILDLIAQGASNKKVAHYLGVSPQTVKNHMSSVMRKLGVVDRTQAAVMALRRGWTRMADS